jgi:hypothetical protein
LSFTEKFRKKEKVLKKYENLSFLNFKEKIKRKEKKKSLNFLKSNLNFINLNSGMQRKLFGSFCSSVRDRFFKENFKKRGYNKFNVLRKPLSKFNEFGKFFNNLKSSFKFKNFLFKSRKDKKELNLIFNLNKFKLIASNKVKNLNFRSKFFLNYI